MLRDGAVAWWPGVRVAPAPVDAAVGAQFLLLVRSPLGYRLRVTMRITQSEPARLIAADAVGDLRGHGAITVRAVGGGSILTFVWEVETQRLWMNLAAPLMHGAFARAHDRVMARGERGLRATLAGRG